MLSHERPERIVFVHNPNSTRADMAKRAYRALASEGLKPDLVRTRFDSAQENIKDLRDHLPDDATFVVAGGDGTKLQVANAMLGKDSANFVIAPLAFGGFNDATRSRDPLEILDSQPIDWHPLSVAVNGRHHLYVPLYFTVGFTAYATKGFGDKESREIQKKTPEQLKTLRSLGKIAADYFQMRDEKLPLFQIDSRPKEQAQMTDILAVNNRRVGRIIRAHDYGPNDHFGFHTADVSTIPKNLPYGAKAIFHQAPAENRRSVAITFENPASIPTQTDGEFAVLGDVEKIEISKNPDLSYRVLRP